MDAVESKTSRWLEVLPKEAVNMSEAIQLLIVEDSEEDAFLLQKILENGGFELTVIRVETSEQLQRALHGKRISISGRQKEKRKPYQF